MDQVQARARADSFIEKTRRQSGDVAAAHAARVMENTLEVIAAWPSDEPPPSIADAVSRLENTDRKADSIVSRWFDDQRNRKYRVLYFLEPADATLRAIATTALREYSATSDVEPTDLVAIATTNRETWRLSDVTTLEVVAETMRDDVACDLDLFKNAESGSCMEGHRRLLEAWDGLDADCNGNPHRQKYVAERFFTVPFARGNVIVLARICDQCFNAFIYGNHIATNDIGIVEPISDGFGSVGGGPIARSEYVWHQTVVEQAADDFEIRNDRRPNVAELQNALQTVPFIGAGSEVAQQKSKKS